MSNRLKDTIIRLKEIRDNLRATDGVLSDQLAHYLDLYTKRVAELCSTALTCHTLKEAVDVLDLHGVNFDSAYRGTVYTYFNSAHDWNVAMWMTGFPVIVLQDANFPFGRRDQTPLSERDVLVLP